MRLLKEYAREEKGDMGAAVLLTENVVSQEFVIVSCLFYASLVLSARHNRELKIRRRRRQRERHKQ